MVERFLGVDFSGGAGPWKTAAPARERTVWIATVEDGALIDLRTVQDLDGEGEPFGRLVALLGAGAFRAAGIDAPMSIPARHLPRGGHGALLQAVARLAPADDRPFPRGEQLVALAFLTAKAERAKPMREAEAVWRQRGLNVRSTLWNGPRGGAPFTVACLTLLARSGAPVWPWSSKPGMLVEVFPMAQLCAWGAPFEGYNGDDGRGVREQIVELVGRKLALPDALREEMLESADALDAVIATFGAMAAATGRLAAPLPKSALKEGAIAVLANDGGTE